MSQHKYESGKASTLKVYNAIKKYGWENVKKEVILTGLSKIEAVNEELSLIAKLDLTKNGYNLSQGGSIPTPSMVNARKAIMAIPENVQKFQALLALHNDKRLASLKSKEYGALRSELTKAQIASGRSGIDTLKKSVVCNETGEKFDSITEAAKHFGGHRAHLRAHLKRDKYRKKFRGMTFEVLN